MLVPGETKVSEAEQCADALIQSADAKAILHALNAAARAGINVSNARRGASTTQSTLETFPELGATLHGTKGRVRFYVISERNWASPEIAICLDALEKE